MEAKIRVLIAEDDALCARLAFKVLCDASGLKPDEVLMVGDGKDALDYLYRRETFSERSPSQPALVLLDLKMPRVDGFDVLQQMKGDPLLRCIPVIVLSSSTQDRDLEQAYALGANGYVVKALDFNVFKSMLDAVSRFWLQVNETPSLCAGKEEP